jgi:hypothetical protein
MRAFVLSAVAAMGLAIAATPSFAQGFGIHVGPGGGGVYVNPGHGHGNHYDDDYNNWKVSRSEAVRIARRNGMEDVYDVDRSGKYWIVRGRNWKGRKVAMRISRYGDWGWY